MPGFCEVEYGCTGQLTIDTTDMFCPAWVTPLLSRLWFERVFRGENILLPGAAGKRGTPRLVDEVDVAFPIYINGVVDEAGAPYANAWDGLWQNLQTLEANVFAEVTTGDGSRAASLLLPDGTTTLTGAVQVHPLEIVEEIEDPTFVVGLMTVTVLAGRLVAA